MTTRAHVCCTQILHILGLSASPNIAVRGTLRPFSFHCLEFADISSSASTYNQNYIVLVPIVIYTWYVWLSLLTYFQTMCITFKILTHSPSPPLLRSSVSNGRPYCYSYVFYYFLLLWLFVVVDLLICLFVCLFVWVGGCLGFVFWVGFFFFFWWGFFFWFFFWFLLVILMIAQRMKCSLHMCWPLFTLTIQTQNYYTKVRILYIYATKNDFWKLLIVPFVYCHVECWKIDWFQNLIPGSFRQGL